MFSQTIITPKFLRVKIPSCYLRFKELMALNHLLQSEKVLFKERNSSNPSEIALNMTTRKTITILLVIPTVIL